MKRAILLISLLLLWGCGSGYGIYHRVGLGETFDDISVAYGVPREHLARINNITDPSAIQEGDAIYVPGADTMLDTRGAAKRGYFSTPPREEPPARREEPPLEASKPAPPPPARVTAPPPVKPPPPPPTRRATTSNRKTRFDWPVKGRVIAKFGTIEGELHDGIDIEAGEGTPVKAAAGGRVIYSGGDIKGYGNMVIIKHEGAYSSVYAHNSENRVIKGDFVKGGEAVALVGSTGKLATPALHFELRQGKKAVDPLSLLP